MQAALVAVTEAEPDKEAASRARQTRHFVRNIAIVAISCVFDGGFLLLFWLAGTVAWQAGAVYGACGLALCFLFWLPIRSGWTWRFKDPHLTLWQTGCAVVMQVTGLAFWPQIGFVFLLLLFVVFITGTMRVPVRQAMVSWVLVSLLVGVVLGLRPQRMHIPDGNLAERVLAVAFFVLTLGRCVFLGAFNSRMRSLIQQRSTELAEATVRVQRLARHDELTGVLNRRSLLEILREEQQRADRRGTPLAVALLDIDFFKAINDTLGHQAGDKTLKIFADAVLRLARGTDRFGRYGGEEFLLVFPATGAEAAQTSVERIRLAVAAWGWHEVAADFRVTFSAGITAYRPGESTEELVNRADEALYRAKAAGRNCTQLG